MRGAVLHFDCTSGLAGDMFLGACLDAGMPLAVIEEAVAGLGLDGVTVEARAARRGGIAGTRFRVLAHGQPVDGPDPDELDRGEVAAPHRHDAPGSHAHDHGTSLATLRQRLAASALAPAVREKALQLLVRVGEAEARVHGVALAAVHFHELAAVDSLVDLVGAAAAWVWLAPQRVTAGRVAVGSGTVAGAHGVLPVPPPAVAELLRGIPVVAGGEGELVTPTGAVLLAELVDDFCELPALTLAAVGYGLGRRETAGRPNAFRLLVGRGDAPAAAAEVVEVSCEVDHVPGEALAFAVERLLGAGALDVFLTAVQMKKGRPGTLVTVLGRPPQLEELAAILLTETGSLGCRHRRLGRFEAERSEEKVATPFGEVRVKRARFAGRELAVSPEFDDCRRLALATGAPWREIWRAALAAAPRSGES